MDDNSLEYFGVISISDVKNIGPNDEILHAELDDQIQLTISRIKLVHYPDCQQLIIWLPQPGTFYESITLKEIEKNIIVWVQNIRDIISGSVQLVFNTLPIPEGNFELSIVKSDGLQHIIKFKKYSEGQFSILPETIPSEPSVLDSEPIVYKDGFEKIIPNEDLILREKIIKKTMNKINRRLEYISQGRDGEVIYIEGEKRIKFYMEIGGYDSVFYVNIPPAIEWETITNFPLEERNDIITFVAEQHIVTRHLLVFIKLLIERLLILGRKLNRVILILPENLLLSLVLKRFN